MLTREDDVEIHALRKQGWTISAIARHLGKDRKTISAYLAGERVAGERARSEPDPFDRFAAYCAERLKEDPHLRASALFDEVVALSYLHRSVVLDITGDSYRLGDHHARADTKRRAARTGREPLL